MKGQRNTTFHHIQKHIILLFHLNKSTGKELKEAFVSITYTLPLSYSFFFLSVLVSKWFFETFPVYLFSNREKFNSLFFLGSLYCAVLSCYTTTFHFVVLKKNKI